LIKHKGWESLTKLSLGKLCQLVQKAIDDKVLQYSKTLLLLSENLLFNQKCQQRSIQELKQVILNILLNKPEGLCLSQLPLFISQELGYQFKQQDYGFIKVKELIENIDDVIEIRLQDKNHPFIYAKKEI